MSKGSTSKKEIPTPEEGVRNKEEEEEEEEEEDIRNKQLQYFSTVYFKIKPGQRRGTLASC
jgi:hypothetical protein